VTAETPAGDGPTTDGRRPGDVPEAGGTFPDVPPDILEAARLAPDHWLGLVDPAWQGEGPPPVWAVVGEWRSGLSGDIEEWRQNEAYRPSPEALGWPAPTDHVDEAVQLASTGYGPGDDVPLRLAGSEVAVLLGPDNRPVAASTPAGDAVIPVFTSSTHLEGVGMLASDVRAVADLVDELPEGHRLYLNPTGPVSMIVETDALRFAIAAGMRQPVPPSGDPMT
jgi:hypothetical protein